MAALAQTKTLRSTWLGRPGAVYALTFDAVPKFGKRVSVLRWEDGTGEVEISAVEGDGRFASRFRFFEKVALTNPSEAEISAAVERVALNFKV